MKRLIVFMLLLVCVPISAQDRLDAPVISKIWAWDWSDNGIINWCLRVEWQAVEGAEKYATRFYNNGLTPRETNGDPRVPSRWRNAPQATVSSTSYCYLDELQNISIRVRAIDGGSFRFGEKSEIFHVALPAFGSGTYDAELQEEVMKYYP